MLSLELALRFIIARKKSVSMSLLGIIFGVAFFVLTQAQTSGFEAFFIRTILGANGALRVSDSFQDNVRIVQKASEDGVTKFYFNSRVDALYREGIDHPGLLKDALSDFPGLLGISEVVEGNGMLDSGSRKRNIEINGIEVADHLVVSNLSEQIIQGSLDSFSQDSFGVLVGSKVFHGMNLRIGDRILLIGGPSSLRLRISGVFESGVSQIDKKRIYLHLDTTRSFLAKRFGGAVFQIALNSPTRAPELASQMQALLNHRVISWQEREQVWLDVFKALRFSSAITVSSIMLLSGLGIFNVFAIMVIEKRRDIAILRSMGFTSADVAAVFLWQGGILLSAGIILGSLFGALATFGVTQIPLRIRGVFSTDSFVVNWDPLHYLWASLISTLFVAIATWIPARRAAKIEPAKIIREVN